MNPAAGAALAVTTTAGAALLVITTRSALVSWIWLLASLLAGVMALRRMPKTAGRRAALWALALLGPQLAAMALTALAPPSSIDALEYHLEAPRRFLREGALVAIPGSHESLQPLNVQLIYALLLPISDRLPALVHTAMGGALAAVVAALARRLVGTPAAVVGALAAVATPMTAWEGPGAFVDLGVALFSAGALLALDTWRRAGHRGALVLAALFAGLAAGSKGTGPALLAALGLATLAAARGSVRPALTLGAIALAVAAPWHLRAFWLTGDPFYPFFSAAPTAVAFREGLRGYGHGRDLLHLALAPVQLVLQGAPFDGGHYLGVAVLALAPAAALHPRAREAMPAWAMGLCFLLAWLAAGSLQARLLLPLAAPAGLAAALGFEALASCGRALAACAVLPVAVTAAAGLGAALLQARQAAPVVLGREPRPAYLARSTIGYEDYALMNRALGPRDKVLLFARGAYYLDVPYERCAPPWCHSLATLDPQAARAAGFTHVYWTGAEPPWISQVTLLRRAPLRVPTRRALGAARETESFLAALETRMASPPPPSLPPGDARQGPEAQP